MQYSGMCSIELCVGSVVVLVCAQHVLVALSYVICSYVITCTF